MSQRSPDGDKFKSRSAATANNSDKRQAMPIKGRRIADPHTRRLILARIDALLAMRTYEAG